MNIVGWLNARLDRCPRGTVTVAGRPRSSFRLFGLLGVSAALVLAVSVAVATGRSPWLLLVLTAVALLTSAAVALATVILTGAERLVCYSHQIAIMVAASLTLAVLGQPVLPYLDLVALGVGTFLIFGRLGCLLVGCCHGRPSLVGIRYPAGLVSSGFDRALVGARLAPTQLYESAGVLGVVLIGTAGALGGWPAGAVLAWWVIGYGVLRFVLEFLRADLGRPAPAGVSQAQWTAVFAVAGVAIAELVGLLPGRGWHLAVAVALLAGLVALIMIGARGGARRRFVRTLRRPAHIHALAASLRDAILVADQPASVGRTAVGGGGQPAGTPMTMRTFAGVVLSAGSVRDPVPARFVTVSADPVLTDRTARLLTRQILRLGFPDQPYRVIDGGAGVYHLLVRR